jgi:hypothetical protein
LVADRLGDAVDEAHEKRLPAFHPKQARPTFLRNTSARDEVPSRRGHDPRSGEIIGAARYWGATAKAGRRREVGMHE